MPVREQPGSAEHDDHHHRSRPSGKLDGFFKITERGSTVGREMRGGLVTFFTMAYIVVLNPLILGFAPDTTATSSAAGRRRSNLAAIAAGTALVAGVMTILMGVVANYPLALATGLGLNAFVAFAIASQMTWADAMGLVVLEGLVILVLVLTGFREAVFHAVPAQLQDRDRGRHRPVHRADRLRRRRLRPPDPDAAAPRCPVQLGADGALAGWPVLVFALGLLLDRRRCGSARCKGAILISIVATTVLAIIVEAIAKLGRRPAPTTRPAGASTSRRCPTTSSARPTSAPLGDFSLFGVVRARRRRRGAAAGLHADAGRLLRHHGHDDRASAPRPACSTRTAVPPNTQRILVVDSVAAAAGGAARRLVEHVLHRVRLRRRRGRPHRPGLRGHRRAVPARDRSSRRW